MEKILRTLGNAADLSAAPNYFSDFRSVAMSGNPPVHPEAFDTRYDQFAVLEIFRPLSSGERKNNKLFLSNAESNLLSSLTNSIIELGEAAKTPAVRVLRQFAQRFAFAVAERPDVRWAVFLEDDDGTEVSLVFHSQAAKRQLSFEFKSSSESFLVIKIDRDMRRSESECQLGHENTLLNAFAWLLNPA